MEETEEQTEQTSKEGKVQGAADKGEELQGQLFLNVLSCSRKTGMDIRMSTRYVDNKWSDHPNSWQTSCNLVMRANWKK